MMFLLNFNKFLSVFMLFFFFDLCFKFPSTLFFKTSSLIFETSFSFPFLSYSLFHFHLPLFERVVHVFHIMKTPMTLKTHGCLHITSTAEIFSSIFCIFFKVPYSLLILFTLHLLLNPFPHSHFYQFFLFMHSLSNMLQFFWIGYFLFNFSHVELGIILTCSIFCIHGCTSWFIIGLNAAMPSSTNLSNGPLTDNLFLFHFEFDWMVIVHSDKLQRQIINRNKRKWKLKL